MKPINLEIEANTKDREGDEESFYISIDGRAYPEVSSGSFFGLGTSVKLEKDILPEIFDFIKRQIEWFESSYSRKVIVKKVILNGKEVIFSNSKTLSSWC